MKIVFFGTGTFGLDSLDALLRSNHQIATVVTNPDRQQGRGLRMVASPVKEWALKEKVSIMTSENVNFPKALEQLESLKADCFIIISFGTILKEALLNMPPQGCINVHPSLLPKYRGASPIVEPILNGDTTVGTTIMRMVQEVDAGDILLQEELALNGNENANEVTESLSALSAKALIQTLDLMESNQIEPKPQDHSQATYCHKLTKDDGIIDWKHSAVQIHNRVRALIQWPGTMTQMKDKRLKIRKTSVASSDVETSGHPGTIIQINPSQGIQVSTGEGALWIQEVQLEGKRPMVIRDFLNGNPLEEGFTFA